LGAESALSFFTTLLAEKPEYSPQKTGPERWQAPTCPRDSAPNRASNRGVRISYLEQAGFSTWRSAELGNAWKKVRPEQIVQKVKLFRRPSR